MTTLDQTIASDLAALSVDNRRAIPAFDATLSTLTPPRIDAPSPAVAHGLALDAAAQVYVDRLVSAAAGAAATLCTLAVLVWFSNPFALAPHSRIATLVDRIVYAGQLGFGAAIAIVVPATYVATRWLARRRGARLLARSRSDALVRLRDRAGSLAELAAGLRVAGTAGIVIVLGMSWVSISLDRYSLFWEHDPAGVLDVMHHAMIGAVLATLALSIGIAMVTRFTRVAAWLAHPVTTASGIVLGAVTVLLGLRLDAGPFFVTFAAARVPSTALRIALTITGTLAVLLVVASAALRRDRRERARLTPD